MRHIFASGKDRQGFTLVEVIVVLVILAVLAAIMIPALTGWIDEAKDESAVVEARTVLTAMQTVATTRYGQGRNYTLADDEAATMDLARVPAGGAILEANVSAKALVTKMVYLTSRGITVTYLNGAFTIGNASTLFLDEDAMAKVYAALKAPKSSSESLGINKTYSNLNTSPAFILLLESLKAQGIDLNSATTTWAIRNNDHNGTGTDYSKIYWTNGNLDNYVAGTPVYAMAYTFSTGNYTVWQMEVKKDGNGPYYLSNEINNSIVNSNLTTAQKEYYGVTGDEQSSQSMLAVYNKIMTSGKYPGN